MFPTCWWLLLELRFGRDRHFPTCWVWNRPQWQLDFDHFYWKSAHHQYPGRPLLKNGLFFFVCLRINITNWNIQLTESKSVYTHVVSHRCRLHSLNLVGDVIVMLRFLVVTLAVNHHRRLRQLRQQPPLLQCHAWMHFWVKLRRPTERHPNLRLLFHRPNQNQFHSQHYFHRYHHYLQHHHLHRCRSVMMVPAQIPFQLPNFKVIHNFNRECQHAVLIISNWLSGHLRVVECPEKWFLVY